MDWKKWRQGLRERPHLLGRVRARNQVGRAGRSSPSDDKGRKDCAGKSRVACAPRDGFGGRGAAGIKIFGVGCVLVGGVALGLGRSGEVIPAGELKGRGELFFRQGEKEPFTGTAMNQVAGKKTEAEFWQGRMHGVYRSWFANGQMEGEAHYEQGLREGRARLWDAKGQMVQETRFRAGLADGPVTEWYPNGKLERRAWWRAGKRHGEIETWFVSGKRKGIGTYEQGERSGTFVVWWESGKKRQETNYKKGAPEGWWVEWKEDGSPTKKAFFKNGKASEQPDEGVS